eukprot:COSAG02_NODE_243_length_27457_cov_16.852328_13_plen_123_part_00
MICMSSISSIPSQLRVKLEANVGKFWIRLQASVPRLRDPTGAYRLLLGSVLESIMIGDSVFRRQPTSALNLRLGRKYTLHVTDGAFVLLLFTMHVLSSRNLVLFIVSSIYDRLCVRLVLVHV